MRKSRGKQLIKLNDFEPLLIIHRRGISLMGKKYHIVHFTIWKSLHDKISIFIVSKSIVNDVDVKQYNTLFR